MLTDKSVPKHLAVILNTELTRRCKLKIGAAHVLVCVSRYDNVAIGICRNNVARPLYHLIGKGEIEVHEHISDLAYLNDAIGALHRVVKGARDLVTVSFLRDVCVIHRGIVRGCSLMVSAYDRERNYTVYLLISLDNLEILCRAVLLGDVTETYREGYLFCRSVVADPLVLIYQAIGIIVGHRLYITDNREGICIIIKIRILDPVAIIDDVILGVTLCYNVLRG